VALVPAVIRFKLRWRGSPMEAQRSPRWRSRPSWSTQGRMNAIAPGIDGRSGAE
jgi:hypothetical protein